MNVRFDLLAALISDFSWVRGLSRLVGVFDFYDGFTA